MAARMRISDDELRIMLAEEISAEPLPVLAIVPRHHRCTAATAFRRKYGRDDHVGMRVCASFRPVEDYTGKYKLCVLMRVCGAS